MTDGEPEACRCAVVKDVNGKPIKADDLGEVVDHASYVVECIPEFFSRRHVGLAETREVWRDHMKFVGEQQNQFTEHVPRGREAVQ